jgi:cell division protein FtsB
LSQVANTFWEDRVERVGAAIRTNPAVKQRVRARRLVDAVVLTIILAAAATCVSVYTRARGELDSAMLKHRWAGEKVEDLTIRVEKLQRDVSQLRTDARVIELFARQRFGFVRSGDVVIKVAQDPNDATTTAASANTRAGNTTADNTTAGDTTVGNNRSGNAPSGARPVGMANLTPRSSDVYTDASN